MTDNLATAYALRARAEARPGLIRDIAISRLSALKDAGFPFSEPGKYSAELSRIADALLQQMYPIEGEK